jgi:hypothetical protein
MSLETDPASIAVGFPLIFNLEMEVEPHSHGDFEIEVFAPYNLHGARAKVCLIEVSFRGSNIGCVNKQNVAFHWLDDVSTDRAVLPATWIENNGYKNETEDPEANVVRFRIVAQVCICMSRACL